MSTIRLTMTQALVKYITAQQVEIDGETLPLVAGVWAIFGHGNVAGIGEALYHAKDSLPTWRAHNEQSMAHAAIAYAKSSGRRRLMACTTSSGPGSANMVTAAALAHVNRLPVLFLPGDTFATRAPDPVLQQVEDFGDPTISTNDCFKPVSRFWDRITRPEQLISSLPRAFQVLTDPVECGPVTISIPQDVQAMAYDYPVAWFEPRVHRLRRQGPDPVELDAAVAALRQAKKPLIVAGGGVLYADAQQQLADFAAKHGIPVAETQAGKGALLWSHPQNTGAIGVTGSGAANRLANEADMILAVGTRMADFTTGSWAVFRNPDMKLIGLNVASFDAAKHRALPLVADAQCGLAALEAGLADWQAPGVWQEKAAVFTREWNKVVDEVTAPSDVALPSDAQVLGVVNRSAGPNGVVVCAAGGLPGELHKLWRTDKPFGYHLEYGYSCMGYEVAGGLGAKMALPERDIYVMVGDGSYLMLNSELATSVMLGQKITVVLLDNRGYGCINRLQQVCGGAPFNNLLADVLTGPDGLPDIDFAMHARSLGAHAEKVANLAELEAALARSKSISKSCVIVIDTDPVPTTEQGGSWWDVAVPEVSQRAEVQQAYRQYLAAKSNQRF
ncbi:MAG: 3D-(3,5/4)-trihydroxycyclohexane-1,2-dione acylhydrolase (decyclizing) [Pseudogulbenkiania sp.]|nr:3D-(3,5/4)-trihydroxycyclohexane-1,2-dione acylhydrolase (decyclizing) [Pseudogulbenkiania sp.]